MERCAGAACEAPASSMHPRRLHGAWPPEAKTMTKTCLQNRIVKQHGAIRLAEIAGLGSSLFESPEMLGGVANALWRHERIVKN